jgi:hypothetical protein
LDCSLDYRDESFYVDMMDRPVDCADIGGDGADADVVDDFVEGAKSTQVAHQKLIRHDHDYRHRHIHYHIQIRVPASHYCCLVMVKVTMTVQSRRRRHNAWQLILPAGVAAVVSLTHYEDGPTVIGHAVAVGRIYSVS